MTKNYIFNISILTHDMVKTNKAEKEFINSAMNQLFLAFLNDNININQSYIIKFERVRYTDTELWGAEKKLMDRCYCKNPDKSINELKTIVRKRILELNPYHIQLSVEVKDDN